MPDSSQIPQTPQTRRTTSAAFMSLAVCALGGSAMGVSATETTLHTEYAHIATGIDTSDTPGAQKSTLDWEYPYFAEAEEEFDTGEVLQEVERLFRSLESMHRILAYRNLEENWNGYGAGPIDEQAILRALGIVLDNDLEAQPRIYPTGS